jgi:predicted metalloprotease
MALVLALVVVGYPAGQASAEASGVPQHAGERVAAATVAVPADSPAVDERSAVAVVDQFWRRHFADTGQSYRSPRVVGGYVGTGGPSCGGKPAVAGNAVYCTAGDFLAWDERLMAAGYEQIGDGWVYLVIAHEWAHAIQARLDRSQVSVAAELQADCLAGAALQGAVEQGLVALEAGDSEELAQGLVASADDYPWTDVRSHGDAQQREAAFSTGTYGGVNACV